MRSHVFALTLLLSFAASTPAATPDPTTNPDVAAGIRIFEAWLAEQMTYRGLPGVAVGVIHDQDLVWARGFGFTNVARKAPMTPASLFRMASNTKMFTSVAILQLRDAGKLRLDDPVAKYLPWFGLKPAAPDDPPVTIENLLTHGSGLPREAASDYWVTFEFPSKDEIRKTIASQTAAYSPGMRFKYSNLALSLAGYIVEEVSGERYADYIARHILLPLGMKSSSIDRKPEPFDRLASGYGRRMPDGSRKQMPWTDCKGVGPAAGLTSSVEDMARFVSLQFRTGPAGGAQILKGPTLREMHRIRFLENTWTRGNGLGFAVWRYKDKIYVGHGGSLAGYKTQTMIQLDDKIGVVVLTNGDDSGPSSIANRAMELIGEPIAKDGAAKDPKPAWDPAWRKYAGLYRSIWGDEQIVETKDALVLINPESDDPQASMMKLKPLGGGRFLLDGPTGGGAIGEEVRFTEAADGTVERMTIGYNTSERVK
jgi:CubicO group peptidase (beta-lactamase class C family)